MMFLPDCRLGCDRKSGSRRTVEQFTGVSDLIKTELSAQPASVFLGLKSV